MTYHRPKTRGELKTKILEGVECEVVASNVETTNIFLDGWLDMEDKYDVRLSENKGWAIYFKNTK